MGKLIGRGAFGKVRLIVDKKSKQQFAMKIVTKPITDIERAQAVDWKAEIELNALIDSEFVVKVMECYDTEEEALIVMELCEKGNLGDYVLQLRKENKKLSEYVSSSVFRFCFLLPLFCEGTVEIGGGSWNGIA
jgi:serine/threonine protein kinase